MNKYLWSVRSIFCKKPTIDASVKIKKLPGFGVADIGLTFVEFESVCYGYIPALQGSDAIISVKPGDKILIPSSTISANVKWVSETVEIDGQSVVVVPFEYISGVIINESAEPDPV